MVSTTRMRNYLGYFVLIVVTAKAENQGCIWYDQCGPGFNPDTYLNCPATNKTQNGPYLRGWRGLEILRRLCPDMYNGINNTRTCCSENQLISLDQSLALPQQMFSRCPNCWKNFVNLFCQMTCSLDQHKFLWPDTTHKYPSGYIHTPHGIPAIDVLLTYYYADGLYNSCKDVSMPSANDKAISMFCGVKAEYCNPIKLLSYMGNVGNGRAAFPINYTLTDKTWISPDNKTLTPLNETNIPCNESAPVRTCTVCSCQDCQASCRPDTSPLGSTPPLVSDKLFFLLAVLYSPPAIYVIYVICVILRSLYKCQCYEFNYDDPYSTKRTFFTKLGTVCASYPKIVITVSIILGASLASGVVKYKVETDPTYLWTTKISIAGAWTAKEQIEYFESSCIPVLRSSQLIISRPHNNTEIEHPYPQPSTGSINFTSLFDLDFMHQILDLQTNISNFNVFHKGENFSLTDICYKPTGPQNEDCAVESVLQYWQNNRTNLDKVAMDEYGIFDLADYFDHFLHCAQNPYAVMDTTKLRMSCLADYGAAMKPVAILGGYDGTNYQNATAFVITFNLITSDKKQRSLADAWEAELDNFLKSSQSPDMAISFVPKNYMAVELGQLSQVDVLPIVLGYITMFVFVTVAFTWYRGLNFNFVAPSLVLGFGAVCIVIVSVMASVGFYSFVGLPLNFITVSVLPFLVLAVGVDNVFFLVHTFQSDKRKPSETLENQIGRVVGSVGERVLLVSVLECVACCFGAVSLMSAVRDFALYAAMAILFCFLLQVTCFISVMSIAVRFQRTEPGVAEDTDARHKDGLCGYVQLALVVLILGMLIGSLYVLPRLEIGLDLSMFIQEDSSTWNWLKNASAYLTVGPTVYFVVPAGYNYSSVSGQTSVCGGTCCADKSMVNQLHDASKVPNYTHISVLPSSWMDDYLSWINSDHCCRVYENGTFCPSIDDANCTRCQLETMTTGHPSSYDFKKYLPMFLSTVQSRNCYFGSTVASKRAIDLLDNDTKVGATYFKTYHTKMTSSREYIDALLIARELATNISKAMNLTDEYEYANGNGVFPYSEFYVFYDQFTNIIGLSLVAGISILYAVIIYAIFCSRERCLQCGLPLEIIMIVIDIVGMMWLWNVSLNSLSVMNLKMAMGIAVVFCLPALVDRTVYWPIIAAEVTLTKVIAVAPLLLMAITKPFLTIYYRMYLAITIIGAMHGLLFISFGPYID